MFFAETYPQQIARHITLFIADVLRPPPFAFGIIAFAQDHQTIVDIETELVIILSFIAKNCIYFTGMKYAEFFLYTCKYKIKNALEVFQFVYAV